MDACCTSPWYLGVISASTSATGLLCFFAGIPNGPRTTVPRQRWKAEGKEGAARVRNAHPHPAKRRVCATGALLTGDISIRPNKASQISSYCGTHIYIYVNKLGLKEVMVFKLVEQVGGKV